jgi:hypothetical protein
MVGATQQSVSAFHAKANHKRADNHITYHPSIISLLSIMNALRGPSSIDIEIRYKTLLWMLLICIISTVECLNVPDRHEETTNRRDWQEQSQNGMSDMQVCCLDVV